MPTQSGTVTFIHPGANTTQPRNIRVTVRLSNNFEPSPTVSVRFKFGAQIVGVFSLQRASSLWQWEGLVPTSIQPDQVFTIEVVASGFFGTMTTEGSASTTVTLENVRPEVAINAFQDPVGVLQAPHVFTLSGSVFTPGNPYSVSDVRYQVNDGPFVAVDPFAPGGTIAWGALVSVPNTGQTVITVRATDNFGTVSTAQKTISVLRYHAATDQAARKTIDREIPTTSSITSWNRLEPQVVGTDLGASSSARLFDPLWMMARQWQIGEFQAEDAGSPAQARVRATTAPLSRLRFPNVSPFPYDPATTPLETLVEHRRMRAVSATEVLTFPLRVEAGLHFLRMLEQRTFTMDYRASLRDHFVLQGLSAEADARADEPTRRFVRTMAGRALDATRLAVLVKNAPGTQLAAFLPGFGIAPADISGMVTLMREWRAWYDALFVEPGSATIGAWTAPHLEYVTSVAARLSATTADSLTLAASEFDGGRLEWSSFDVDRVTPIDTSADAAFTALGQRTVPVPVRFPGAPAPRFWEMEDAKVAYGIVPVGPTDLAQLMMIEYAGSYGNDWFMVPLTTRVGTVTRVESLVVTDTFGMRTLVRPIGDPALATPHFSMWQQSTMPWEDDPAGTPVRNRFFLPPTIARSLDGPVLEDVLFTRDEMANVAWAIERRVEGGLEAPVTLTSVGESDTPEAPSEAFGTERYVLASPVPANWVPLLPVQKTDDDGQPLTRLQRGAMLVPDGSHVVHTAKSEVLKSLGSELLFDEEVPREGVHITRRRRMVRWIDGSTWAWTAFRNDVGTGEGSSGMQFDQLQSTDGAVIVSDTPPVIGTLFTDFGSAVLGGPSAAFQATFDNDGPTRANASFQGFITQGAARRAATPLLPVSFDRGAGVLPHGSRTVVGDFAVSNLAPGTGTLAPGDASLELQLLVDGTELATRTIPLTLVYQATTVGIVVSGTPLVVNGDTGSYTATVRNQGSALTAMELRGWIRQNAARRAAGNVAVSVGGPAGELPAGTFQVTGSMGASNTANGAGTLVVGPAILELELVESGVIRHTATVPIALQAVPPTISALTLTAPSVMIDGVRPTYNYTLENTGTVHNGMALLARFVQGATVRSTTFPVSVGAGSGVLSTGSFNRTALATAYNNLDGTGTLVAGTATFELQLLDASGAVVASRSLAVTLVPPPVIAAFTPSLTSFVIGGPAVPYTATINNPGPSVTLMSLRCVIVQGTVSHTTFPSLGGSTLPTGVKPISASIAAPSATANGTLVPGPATLQLRILHNSFQVIATVSVPVTLTSA
jgi:hypothetical protein